MGFTKLDEGILQSSVMAESGSVFKVWIALLASCGQDGIAKVSSVFLSSACHLPQKTVDHAIENLSSPDPRSRSLNDEGRRIQRVDGGYRVINYEKYRAFSPNEGNPNSPGALRVRRWREKQKSVTCPPDVTPGNVTSVTSASASASASASKSSLSEEGKKSEEGEAAPVIPTTFIESAKKEIPRIFSEGGHSELLSPAFLAYLVNLSWEFKDIDLEDEIKGKFAHWTKYPLTKKSNLCLQFRNWFRMARKIESDRQRERLVGHHRPEA
jgi:hypothetical protein